MRIALLSGGFSPERNISIKSGDCIEKSLNRLGHDVFRIDPDENVFSSLNENGPFDLIYNSLHGLFGEDGRIQGGLELMNIPFTHSSSLASTIAMNKILSKKLFIEAGIKVPHGGSINDPDTFVPENYPLIIKDNNGGSSIGVFKINNLKDLENWKKVAGNIDWIFEENIEGREITCAVLGSNSIGLLEIKTAYGQYDYEAKYLSSFTGYEELSDSVSDIAKEKMMYYSEVAHRICGCEVMSRADFRLNPEKPDDPFLLETNSQPGMTASSLFPKIAENYGISFDDLVSRVIALSLEKESARKISTMFKIGKMSVSQSV